MAIRRTLAQFSDEIVAADIAANAVGASELADDAVDTAAIATNAVTATEIVAGAVTEAKLNADVTDGSAITTSVNPHIIPGVLQPAVAGKLLNGATHSGAYGTAQSQSGGDGHKYYYTDIKGSKPIKDPRIGAHFGSQRHKFKSLQLLEQETATDGNNVYSVDGREWMRVKEEINGKVAMYNNAAGLYLGIGGSAGYYSIEIVGYFSDANYIGLTRALTALDFVWKVDGGSFSSARSDFETTINSPFKIDRYVDQGSVVNIGLGATLGLHTLIIRGSVAASELDTFGIELIAQDTTSATTKSQIQIPSQNVVSYGKKFTVSGTPHYNPFAESQTGAAVVINSSTTNTAKLTGGWAGTGATYYSSELDTATSLGLSAWVSGGEYFRPVNGGRIVWWINSAGSLKCSVNMMPPAGTAIGGVTSGHNVPTGVHNWATKYQPALHSATIDHSQAEVAKTFYPQEFGNGGANGGVSGTYLDASMLDGTGGRNVAYVMDDGLTSLIGEDVRRGGNALQVFTTGTSDFWFITFIGTGITLGPRQSSVDGTPVTIAQNLPYGTHILKILSDSTTHQTTHLYVDGPTVHSSSGAAAFEYGGFWNITFHQPKMPPIPENAVVLADYMLMADYVPDTLGSKETTSKGVRMVESSRDIFYDTSAGSFTNLGTSWDPGNLGFFVATQNNQSADVVHFSLPAFATKTDWIGYGDRRQIYVDSGSAETQTLGSGSTYETITKMTNAQTLGTHIFRSKNKATTTGHTSRVSVASPIHTSSHYQSFETPFTHDLVGGDRNMEQTNLVVTPDGKTWDEVTRDTSYISNGVKVVTTMGNSTNWENAVIFDDWRGNPTGDPPNRRQMMNKDFAISWDRLICLKDGKYTIRAHSYASGTSTTLAININGTYPTRQGQDNDDSFITLWCTAELIRGDYVKLVGEFGAGGVTYNNYTITRET